MDFTGALGSPDSMLGSIVLGWVGGEEETTGLFGLRWFRRLRKGRKKKQEKKPEPKFPPGLALTMTLLLDDE